MIIQLETYISSYHHFVILDPNTHSPKNTIKPNTVEPP